MDTSDQKRNSRNSRQNHSPLVLATENLNQLLAAQDPSNAGWEHELGMAYLNWGTFTRLKGGLEKPSSPTSNTSISERAALSTIPATQIFSVDLPWPIPEWAASKKPGA